MAITLNDGLNVAKIGADLFGRFSQKRRENKNAKRIAETQNAVATQDMNDLQQSLNTANAMGLGVAKDAYGDPAGMEGGIKQALMSRFNPTTYQNIQAAQPAGRTFTNALNKSYGDAQGKLNTELTTKAGEVAAVSAPGLADKARWRMFQPAAESINQELRKATLAASVNPLQMQAATDAAYQPTSTAEKAASIAPAAISGVQGLLSAFSKQKAKPKVSKSNMKLKGSSGMLGGGV